MNQSEQQIYIHFLQLRIFQPKTQDEDPKQIKHCFQLMPTFLSEILDDQIDNYIQDYIQIQKKSRKPTFRIQKGMQSLCFQYSSIQRLNHIRQRIQNLLGEFQVIINRSCQTFYDTQHVKLNDIEIDRIPMILLQQHLQSYIIIKLSEFLEKRNLETVDFMFQDGSICLKNLNIKVPRLTKDQGISDFTIKKVKKQNKQYPLNGISRMKENDITKINISTHSHNDVLL